MNRRDLLRAAVVAAAAGTGAACSANKSPYRLLTAREGSTLQAICQWIIPEDQEAGAARAGVVNYIDRQLAGKFRGHRKTYREGLAAADALAGGSFAHIPAAQQLLILRRMERDAATRPFFELVLAHSMQGFYGNPSHGGNRDFVSWRMLRLPISPVRGRDRYTLPPRSRP